MGKYFTIDELCYTEKELDNTPSEQVKQHLEELIEVLDSIREGWTELCKQHKWGNPAIKVNSGYRSYEVNRAVGGSKTSEHCLGYAADIEPYNQRNLEFFNYVKDFLLINNIPFSQLINEKPRAGIPSWVHLSINGRKGHRGQIFTLV